MKRFCYLLILLVCGCEPCLADELVELTAGLGQLVELKADAHSWSPHTPFDLKFVRTHSGAAIATGCAPATLVIDAIVVDWDARTLDTKRFIIRVGNGPRPPPGPAPPGPGPDPPDPDLSGLAKFTRNKVLEIPAASRGIATQLADNFDTISSRGAGLSEWTGKRIIQEINKANRQAAEEAGAYEEWKRPIMDIFAQVAMTVSLEDKSAVIKACQDIARGLRAAG